MAATIVASNVLGNGAGAQQGSEASVDLTTVEVEARTLRTYLTYDGTLEIGTTESLTAGRSGTITATSSPGSTIEAGGALVRIDDEPVTVLYGTVPMYRALEAGDEGVDVAQLETFLALGEYDAAAPITVDETFTSSTATALGNWQEANGLETTGTLAVGTFVVARGPVEVLEVAAIGDVVRDGDALASVSVGSSATIDIVDGDARPLVVATVPATPTITLSVVPDEVDIFAVGDMLEVESAGGETHDGTVIEIGSVAVSDPLSADGEAGVAVVIEVDSAADVLAGPAEVRVIEAERVDAIAVPTRALVALAEGGNAVEIVDGDQQRLIGVELGIFADGWVEITSDSESGTLRPGVEVVVPS